MLASGHVETPEEKAENQRREREKAELMEKRLKDERALIFQNLLNDVPVWQVAHAYHRSQDEVMNIFNFIMRKIRSRVLERMERPIFGTTIEEIQKSKRRCLAMLPFLNLDKEPRYANVLHEHIEIKRDGTTRNLDLVKQIKPE
jgi:hypothetical protein